MTSSQLFSNHVLTWQRGQALVIFPFLPGRWTLIPSRWSYTHNSIMIWLLPKSTTSNTITLATGLQFISLRDWGRTQPFSLEQIPSAHYTGYYLLMRVVPWSTTHFLSWGETGKQRLLTPSELGELARQPLLTFQLHATCEWHNHKGTTSNKKDSQLQCFPHTLSNNHQVESKHSRKG